MKLRILLSVFIAVFQLANAQQHQDTIKVKLEQKLQTLTDNNDKEIITELISLHEKIGAIKSDYSNVDSVATLKSYKKRLADHIPDYKRLQVMEGFVFNFRKIFRDINHYELKLQKEKTAHSKEIAEASKKRVIKVKQEVEQGAKDIEAAKFYNRIVKQKYVSKQDVIKFKAQYPEYANRKAKGGNNTWLELLEQVAK